MTIEHTRPQTTPNKPRRRAGARRVVLQNLTAYYGDNTAVRNVSLEFAPNEVTAIIGPSGCGKSTLVRCVNRMHEVIPGARVEGSVPLDGYDIYGPGADPVAVRTVIGMVFQKPNPFPTMSIYDNVAVGLRADPGSKGTRTRSSSGRCTAPASGTRSRTGWQDPASASRAASSSGSASRAPRGRARGDPDGRALLGARPDRDRRRSRS